MFARLTRGVFENGENNIPAIFQLDAYFAVKCR
jgi:hypothetical protein